MNLAIEPYQEQQARWPKTGQHILAQHSDLVREQRQHLAAPTDKTVRRYERLMTPAERVYPVPDAELAKRLCLSSEAPS